MADNFSKSKGSTEEEHGGADFVINEVLSDDIDDAEEHEYEHDIANIPETGTNTACVPGTSQDTQTRTQNQNSSLSNTIATATEKVDTPVPSLEEYHYRQSKVEKSTDCESKKEKEVHETEIVTSNLGRLHSATSGVTFMSDLSSLTGITPGPPTAGLRRGSHVRHVSPGAFSVEGINSSGLGDDLQDDNSTVVSNTDFDDLETLGTSQNVARPDPPSNSAGAVLHAEVVDDAAQREQLAELLEMNRTLMQQLQALGGAAVRRSQSISSAATSQGPLFAIAEAQHVTLLHDDVEDTNGSSQESAATSSDSGGSDSTPLSKGTKQKRRFLRYKATSVFRLSGWPVWIGTTFVLVVIVIGIVVSQNNSRHGSNRINLGGDELEDEVILGAPSVVPYSGIASLSPAPTPPLHDESLNPSSAWNPEADGALTPRPTIIPYAQTTLAPSVGIDRTSPPTRDVATPRPTIFTSLTHHPTPAPTTSNPTRSPVAVPAHIQLSNPPTSLPTRRPTPSPTFSIRAIQSSQELKAAVDVYLRDPTPLSMAAKLYGWPIGEWDVSLVEDFSRLFSADRNHQAGGFNDYIGGWDVSRATDMSEMFSNARSFNQNLDWDTGRVRNFSRMFSGAASFAGDISSWDTRKATSMVRMFANAERFNGNISRWSVSSVTTFEGMFLGTRSFKGNLARWSPARASNMNSMFSGALSFKQDLCSWGSSISTNTDVGDMFSSTKCDFESDPNLTQNIPGPFCARCSDPTTSPTPAPTTSPTEAPTANPSTRVPTTTPSTSFPSRSPSGVPTLPPTKELMPTQAPTESPVASTVPPSLSTVSTKPPQDDRVGKIGEVETDRPTESPIFAPTLGPTMRPTSMPPTTSPTHGPTPTPSRRPSPSPTATPSTDSPSMSPSATIDDNSP